MITQGEVLRQLIRAGGYTQESFGEKVGKDRVTVGRWIKNKGELPKNIIELVAKALDVPVDVFQKGDLSAKEVLKSMAGESENYRGATILHVPIEAEAGFIGGHITPVLNYDLKEWTLPGFDEKGYSFEVKGESMYPTFKNGEIVVTGIKHEPYELIRKEYVYVVVCPDNIVIKRVVADKKHKGKLRLLSDNTNNADIEIDYDDVKLYRARRNITYDLSKRYPV